MVLHYVLAVTAKAIFPLQFKHCAAWHDERPRKAIPLIQVNITSTKPFPIR